MLTRTMNLVQADTGGFGQSLRVRPSGCASGLKHDRTLKYIPALSRKIRHDCYRSPQKASNPSRAALLCVSVAMQHRRG